MKRPLAEEQHWQFFAVCQRCNTILNPQAATCHACGGKQIEKRSILEVASRFRDIIRTESASLR